MLVEADTDSISFKFINTNDSLIDHFIICPFQTGKPDENNGTGIGNISIYPNPATSCIYVNIKNGTVHEKITIYDSFGRELFEKNLVNDQNNFVQKIDVFKFKNGLYFLCVSCEKNVEYRKIIIN